MGHSHTYQVEGQIPGKRSHKIALFLRELLINVYGSCIITQVVFPETEWMVCCLTLDSTMEAMPLWEKAGHDPSEWHSLTLSLMLQPF